MFHDGAELLPPSAAATGGSISPSAWRRRSFARRDLKNEPCPQSRPAAAAGRQHP